MAVEITHGSQQMTDHIQPNDLDLMIESRFCPGRLRKFAEHFQSAKPTQMLPNPEYVASELIRMAEQVEIDNKRLRYHLKTMVGKAVGSVVLHLDKEDDRCCAHCNVPMREHLSVDCLCAANVKLSKELTDAKERLKYAEVLSKSLLEDAKIIDDPHAQVGLSQARLPKQ